jgi:ubiquinone/menaquinone biosynthesis C-methylase UbiE
MNEPIDTSQLDPATLAKHLGNPEGEIGKAVTANLNKTNAGAYSAVFQKLGVTAGDRIIEIGFGNGREIPRILSLADGVTYFGLDISETMVADATAHNSEQIREGRVTLTCGSSSNIPADARAFTRALALNTIYFWEDPVSDLKELRRVLQPSGRLVLGAMAPWSATGPFFQHGFRHYEKPELENFLKRAGFSNVSIDTINETVMRASGSWGERDFFIIVAE